LVYLVEAFGRRAKQKDNQHRIISIKKNKSDLVITTTENQLAVKIAKKIKNTFKKTDIKISYSPAPSDVVYIKLDFKK
jgi:chlorite dismutase